MEIPVRSKSNSGHAGETPMVSFFEGESRDYCSYIRVLHVYMCVFGYCKTIKISCGYPYKGYPYKEK